MFFKIIKQKQLHILILLIIGCNNNIETHDNGHLEERIGNLTFHYHLDNNLLNDTLIVTDNINKPILKQVWSNGILKKTYRYDLQLIRELRFVSIPDSDERSFRRYYTDVNDTNYQTLPYSKEFNIFYHRHLELSIKTISNFKPNFFKELNVPNEGLGIIVAGYLNKISKVNDDIILTTSKQKGDSVKLSFVMGMETEEYPPTYLRVE